MTIEDMEEVAMLLIGHAGESKSDYIMAIREAKEGNFDEAEKIMTKGGDEMLKAHAIQTNLITKEAGGEKMDMGLIMVHAQDHLMSAVTFKDIAREMIDLYKKIYAK